MPTPDSGADGCFRNYRVGRSSDAEPCILTQVRAGRALTERTVRLQLSVKAAIARQFKRQHGRFDREKLALADF